MLPILPIFSDRQRNFAALCSSKGTIGLKVLAKYFGPCYMLTSSVANQPSERECARLYSESEAASFSLSLEEFANLFKDTQPDRLRSVRLKDFVLARACAHGHTGAWEFFITHYREKLYLAAIAITHDEVRGRELADSLWADLYSARTSKLNSFLGRGSLEGWLKTILAQEFVNRIRKERKLVPFDDALETLAQSEEPDPLLDQRALASATDFALAALSAEDRFLLAAYYLDERTLSEIGRMLGTHESTISRRLDKITNVLRKQIIACLCKTGIPKRAAEEMLDIDVRDLAINVREKLAQERRA